MSRYGDKLSRLGVAHFELKMVCRFGADSAPVPLRMLASNPTGYVLHIGLLEGKKSQYELTLRCGQRRATRTCDVWIAVSQSCAALIIV